MIKRLSSIELQGIKTFATSTRLEFPGQITAIVGPNGSGKSNIADSIRWVLGEQSYSVLRAKRTEDMIFSGSQQRPRTGMASTTITFNNEDGWLPIDYAEVSISRRAYRDGQNEYILNGQKVRLKDVSELLSHTGLAERTYTIIGQGLVDVALALKPDERRKLFEEAAGIGLYQSRKEESQRRLEKTRKNLDRVLDIMTEIRPRLRSLEKQAARFDEFQRLRDDLEELLRQWYGYYWHQKQQDLKNIRSDFQNQEKKLADFRKKDFDVESQVEESRQKLQANRKNLEDAHRELSELHRQMQQATRDSAILEERQHSNNQQKSNLEIDIANLQEEIAGYKQQEKIYTEEIVRRKTEAESAVDTLSNIEQKLAEITAQKEESEGQLSRIRKDRIRLETDRVQQSARLEELNNRIQALTSENQKIEESILDLNKERDDISLALKSLKSKFEKDQRIFLETEEQLTQSSNKLVREKLEKETLDKKISARETETAKLNAQLEVLHQAEAALNGYSQGSKTLLDFSRKGRLPAGIEPLSKFLLVDELYEKAIGASLGELTDLLIVPEAGSDVVIEFLENKDSERVALVSLKDLSPNKKRKSVNASDGFIGYANELVETSQTYKPLVDHLFSQILLVKDKKSAERIQSQLEGDQKAVTLSGLVFHATGVVISGQNASGKRIGRTRQTGELQKEIEKVSANIQNLRRQSTTADVSIAAQQKEVESLKETRQQAQIDLNKSEAAFQEASGAKSRLNERISWHNDRLADIQKNLTATQQMIEADRGDIAEKTKRIQTLLGEEKILQEKINEIPVFDIQQELNQWQTHQAVAKNALLTSQQRFEDHQGRLSDMQQHLETYHKRLAAVESSLENIIEKKGLLRDQIQLLDQRIEQLELEKIKPLTGTGSNLEQQLLALEKSEDQQHQQVIIAERQYTQYQLELARQEDQLNNLREKIESDFGLVSFEYDQKIDGPSPLPYGDGLIEDLPSVKELPESIDEDIKLLKRQVRRLGAINPEAQQEYTEVKDRYEFLTEQVADLEKASEDLTEVINELDTMMERDFLSTVKAVNSEFSVYFTRLFNGGEAKLMFSDEENPVEGGVDIEARLPGRRRQGLALLSGGERSLTAVALVFALLKVSPTPFCVLDEVDAMLDESNVGRFIELLKDLAQNTQFVIITHNRNTVQAADVIYGVTMGRDSTSQMISLKLEDVDEAYLK